MTMGEIVESGYSGPFRPSLIQNSFANVLMIDICNFGTEHK